MSTLVHMTARDGFYWLEQPQCPPIPQLGHGVMADRAQLEWNGPGWYGPGTMQYGGYDRPYMYIYYEHAERIENDLKDTIRNAAMRLRAVKQFTRE